MKDATEPPSQGRFILSVCYSTTQYPRRLLVSPHETIADLKTFCAPWVNAFVDEIDVFLRRDFPYPLSEEMVLGILHDEHRTLFLHVRDPTCRTIPLRFVRQEADEKGEERILDLTTLPPSWNQYVERWLRDDSMFHVIMIDGTRAESEEVLYTLGEIIRTLPILRRIWIKGSYLRVSYDAIAYMRYHLAMDQYRTYSVEVIVEESGIKIESWVGPI